jgi:hypothetical protein
MIEASFRYCAGVERRARPISDLLEPFARVILHRCAAP